MKILIGLPAYNEELNIGKLLEKIQRLQASYSNPVRVVVVNDGSTDGTENILKSYAGSNDFITYINHATNKGLGKAVETILTYAVSRLEDGDALVIFDADNTHNPSIIPQMVDKLEKNQLDIAIASRFAEEGREIGVSGLRKLFSRGAMVFCALAFHLRKIKDYSCGYRIYRAEFLKKYMAVYGGEAVSSRGFECMVEILAKAGKIGARIGEYPLVLEYNLKEGASKMRAVRTILGYVRLAVKIRKPKTAL
jgi:dolichol-phosphate mannosyltransferase